MRPRRASADRITAVLPFYGYARQDRKDQPRVPITAKLVANLLVAAGANRVLTMDLHAQQIQGFFDIPVDHLYAAPVFYKYITEKELKDLVVVSPDVGGMKMAAAYSRCFTPVWPSWPNGGSVPREIENLYLVGDVKDRDVLMVDDMTETAGTLTTAAKTLKAAGARNIYAAVSHAILNPAALERLKNFRNFRDDHDQLDADQRHRRRADHGPGCLPLSSARASNASTTANPSPPFSKSVKKARSSSFSKLLSHRLSQSLSGPALFLHLQLEDRLPFQIPNREQSALILAPP